MSLFNFADFAGSQMQRPLLSQCFIKYYVGEYVNYNHILFLFKFQSSVQNTL